MRKLWEDHITWTRLAIVSFAGNLPDLQATEARLLANQTDIGNAVKPYYGRTAGNRLTALLHGANPRNWGRAEMRAMMKTHLDETLKEAQDRLAGNFPADIRDYEAVHHHILEMADELSNGIMRQLPRRFR